MMVSNNSIASFNFDIQQGDTFTILDNFNLKDESSGAPIDITGYTIRLQGRAKKEDFTPEINLSSLTGEIIIDDPVNGIFSITIDSSTTAAYSEGQYFYDLELESPSNITTTIFSGIITVWREITR